LDEYRVNRKTFARGGHYLVADLITSFLIRFQTTGASNKSSGRTPQDFEAANIY
jgi:hypothetical protein